MLASGKRIMEAEEYNYTVNKPLSRGSRGFVLRMSGCQEQDMLLADEQTALGMGWVSIHAAY